MGVNLEDVLGKKQESLLEDKSKKQMNMLLIVIAIVVIAIVIVAIKMIGDNNNKKQWERLQNISAEVNAISIKVVEYKQKHDEGNPDYKDFIGIEQENEKDPKKQAKIDFMGQKIEFKHGYYLVNKDQMNDAKFLGSTSPRISASSNAGYAINYENGNVVYLDGITYKGEKIFEKDDISNAANGEQLKKRIIIRTVDDVAALQDPNNLNATFILNADIDMSGYKKEWVPLGTDGRMFNGVFDGKGYRIYNFSIDKSDIPNMGFFGYVGKDAVIKNMVLINCNVKGGKSTGAIASVCHGTIENCKVNGVVITGQHDMAGGIVGSFDGNASNIMCNVNVNGHNQVGGFAGTMQGGKVSKVFVREKTIITGEREVGGLIGNVFNANAINIDQCSAKANVSAAREVAGGLIGYVVAQSADRNSNIIIQHSYARGNIALCPKKGGGFMGELMLNGLTDVHFKYNYAYTFVTRECLEDRGGFAGAINGSLTYNFEENFWLKENAELLTGVGNSEGDVKKDVINELSATNHTTSDFTSWNLDKVWNVEFYPVVDGEPTENQWREIEPKK
ncbi:MAG: hypothetical protein IKI57_05140 [Clostridia bacterium]|nr:hypothetical protein [Clostridia bacterium]